MATSLNSTPGRRDRGVPAESNVRSLPCRPQWAAGSLLGEDPEVALGRREQAGVPVDQELTAGRPQDIARDAVRRRQDEPSRRASARATRRSSSKSARRTSGRSVLSTVARRCPAARSATAAPGRRAHGIKRIAGRDREITSCPPALPHFRPPCSVTIWPRTIREAPQAAMNDAPEERVSPSTNGYTAIA